MNTPPQRKPQLNTYWIDDAALEIVHRLQRAGHITYLVGGCVRDLLLGQEPKDFDISTSAHPNQVKRLIPYSYVIGKRFRLVLVKRGTTQFEVSTFRKLQEGNGDGAESSDGDTDGDGVDFTEDKSAGGDGAPIPEEGPKGLILDDNVFGSPQEDALRRDFTINGLFYNPESGDLIDHVEGLKDIQEGYVKMIGDPLIRLEEDPIRILRALRMAHKAQFSMDPELRSAILDKASTVQWSVLPRRREEVLKWLQLKNPSQIFLEAFDLGVLEHLLPTLHHNLLHESAFADQFFFYLDQYALATQGAQGPKDLFSNLLFAFFKSFYEARDEKPPSTLLLDQPLFASMMRDELGMFKYEQHDIARAFQALNLFAKFKDFKKRSKSRQLAFFKSDSFPLAFELVQKDVQLDPSTLRGWRELYQHYLPEIKESSPSQSSKPGRGRPRRRRTQKNGQRS